ncbi:unnamed protein product [Pleuronectes platessa]|uniref:Essential protein Yae1 N-terminal domain-containing protein n=1 Tax=Pleuronectes platessa TaxID=8262 RepID=A0A9N7Z295_PLEPL|nr:unnamed protein product [Pleuronectes platessa]
MDEKEEEEEEEESSLCEMPRCSQSIVLLAVRASGGTEGVAAANEASGPTPFSGTETTPPWPQSILKAIVVQRLQMHSTKKQHEPSLRRVRSSPEKLKMSWLKAASLSAEDVFDEAGDEMKLQTKEWSSNMNKRVKDGYVDGVNAGEDAALQLGFNQGFREGATRTVAVGRLKGIISAIWCWCQIEHPETPVPARVTELLQRVSQHEDRIADGIRKSMENPPPSVSDVSESMEDLEVKQADPSCCGDGGLRRGDGVLQPWGQNGPGRSSATTEALLGLELTSARAAANRVKPKPHELQVSTFSRHLNMDTPWR